MSDIPAARLQTCSRSESSSENMKQVAGPAFKYTAIVFAIGFLAGTVRVLFLVPRIGETAAVLAELPLMLTASFFVARWVVRRDRVARTLRSRARMGLMSFAILMAFETAVSLAVFGNTLTEHLTGYLSPPAWLGVFGQIVFAAMPALLLLRKNGS